MPEFDSFEDNLDNQEPKLSLGVVRDVSGNLWKDRSDEVIKRYLVQTSTTPDQKIEMRGLIDTRNWLGLDKELNKILVRSDTDDTIRINKVKDLIDKILKEDRLV